MPETSHCLEVCTSTDELKKAKRKFFTNKKMKNINSVAIVDDDPLNLEAAVIAFSEIFPGINISTFNSSSEFFEAVGESCPNFDIIFTDMNMEEKKSGFKVARLGWSWFIPTVIVSGGISHGMDYVSVGYFHIQLGGSKNMPNIWKAIIKSVLNGANNNPVTISLNTSNKFIADQDLGEVGAIASSLWVY